MKCTGCGADLDFREAFCSKCGELTPRGDGFGALVKQGITNLVPFAFKLGAVVFTFVADPANRRQVGAGVALLTVLLITLTNNPISRSVGNIVSPAPEGRSFNDVGSPNFVQPSDSVPENLWGPWSDYAACLASGRSTTIILQEDGFDLGSARYDYSGATSIERGYPAHSFVVAGGENDGRTVVMWAASDLSQIWIRFGESPGDRERFFLPGSRPCEWAIPKVREIQANN